jgi:probable rRNA maturation factor
MHLVVDLIKQVPGVITKSFATKVIRATLQNAAYDFLEKKHVSVNVVFVSREEIQQLNRTVRRRNKVTDVLSFPNYANKTEMAEDIFEDIFLGELIICYDYIVASAIEDKVSLEQEMAYIISHGILHLLGFRHSEKMFALQDGVSEVYATVSAA